MEVVLGSVEAFVGKLFWAKALAEYIVSQLVGSNASEIGAPCMRGSWKGNGNKGMCNLLKWREGRGGCELRYFQLHGCAMYGMGVVSSMTRASGCDQVFTDVR